MSDLFRQKTSDIQRVGKALKIPQDFTDPFDFRLNVGGSRAVRVKPSAGKVKVRNAPGFTQSIGRARDANIAANSRFGTLIGDLESNQNPFIRARVRPAEEAAREAVARTTRDVGRRNIHGSLGQNQINNAEFLGARGVGDAGALATQEALQGRLQAEAGRLGVGSETLQIADEQLRGELASIDAGMRALETSLGNQFQTSTQLSSGDIDVPNQAQEISGIVKLLQSIGIV